MTWIGLALFSAIMLASRRVYEKDLTGSFSNYTVGFLTQAFAIVPSALLLLFFPIPSSILALPWDFWWPLLIIWFVLYPIQTYFTYIALKEGDLSDVTPVIALLPVFNMLTSYILIGELPTILGVGGILLIVIATLLVLTQGRRLSELTIKRPVLFALISVASVALGSSLDKIAITASTPVFYSFANLTGSAVVLGAIAWWFGQLVELRNIRPRLVALHGMGIMRTLAVAASMVAFSLGPTAYVLAVRSSSFIMTAAYGMWRLNEAITVRKISALILFTGGLVLITLS